MSCCQWFYELANAIILDDISGIVLYNKYMKKIPLSKTNPYLIDADKRKELLLTFVDSSSAIEGIHVSSLIKRKPSSKLSLATACRESEESYGSRR